MIGFTWRLYFSFFLKISLINRQKAHPQGKSLLKQENIDREWTIWEKRFSYNLGSPQPLDKKIEKFLARLISGRVPKRGEEKEGDAVIFALRYKESGFGLCLKFMDCNKQGSNPKFTLMSSFRGKVWKTHKWKIRVFRNSVFRLPKF